MPQKVKSLKGLLVVKTSFDCERCVIYSKSCAPGCCGGYVCVIAHRFSASPAWSAFVSDMLR